MTGAVVRHPPRAEELAAGGVDPQDRVDAPLTRLGTRAEGLSPREAQRRLTQET
jgi:hypothetical protein